MNKKKPPEETKEFQIDKEELEALSARVAERKLGEDDWQRLHRYLVLLLKLTQVLEYGRVRTRKLMRLLFGKRTEKDKTEEGKTGKDNPKPPLDSPTAAGAPDAAGSAAGGSAGQTESAPAGFLSLPPAADAAPSPLPVPVGASGGGGFLPSFPLWPSALVSFSVRFQKSIRVSFLIRTRPYSMTFVSFSNRTR